MKSSAQLGYMDYTEAAKSQIRESQAHIQHGEDELAKLKIQTAQVFATLALAQATYGQKIY